MFNLHVTRGGSIIMSYSGIRLYVWTNLEEEGAYPHTLHTKGEKVCNLHVNGGMISQKLYHTQAYDLGQKDCILHVIGVRLAKNYIIFRHTIVFA